jgi:hypothetical protein
MRNGLHIVLCFFVSTAIPCFKRLKCLLSIFHVKTICTIRPANPKEHHTHASFLDFISFHFIIASVTYICLDDGLCKFRTGSNVYNQARNTHVVLNETRVSSWLGKIRRLGPQMRRNHHNTTVALTAYETMMVKQSWNVQT